MENADVYICPKCGSTNWKFPNPIKPASMINTASFSNLNECSDCSYIGIFFVADKKSAKKMKNRSSKVDS